MNRTVSNGFKYCCWVPGLENVPPNFIFIPSHMLQVNLDAVAVRDMQTLPAVYPKSVNRAIIALTLFSFSSSSQVFKVVPIATPSRPLRIEA